MNKMRCHICLEDIKISKYPEYHDRCVKKLFGSIKVSPHLDFDKKDFITRIAMENSKRMSISGVQQKLSMRLDGDRLVPTDVNGTYILKPTPYEFPEASENEHASMLMGAIADIETPPLGLVLLKDGEKAYIIKRFDKNENARVHCEDMTQLLGLNRDTEGEYKYLHSYEEVGKAILKYTNGNKGCVMDFIRRLIFNFLINNGDYHLKNISLQLVSPSRESVFDKMTPNYDNLDTRIYFPGEYVFALDFLAGNSFTKEYEALGFFSRADFLELGKRLGINDKAVNELISSFISKKEKMTTVLQKSFMSNEISSKYIGHMSSRFKALEQT